MTAALEGGEWSAAAPAELYPRERTSTHFTGGWVGPRVDLGGRKILVATGIRSWTVQPVVSSYTDWTTGPTVLSMCLRYKTLKLCGIICLMNSEVCEGKHLESFLKLAFTNLRFIAWSGLRETSVRKGRFVFSITIRNVY